MEKVLSFPYIKHILNQHLSKFWITTSKSVKCAYSDLVLGWYLGIRFITTAPLL